VAVAGPGPPRTLRRRRGPRVRTARHPGRRTAGGQLCHAHYHAVGLFVAATGVDQCASVHPAAGAQQPPVHAQTECSSFLHPADRACAEDAWRRVRHSLQHQEPSQPALGAQRHHFGAAAAQALHQSARQRRRGGASTRRLARLAAHLHDRAAVEEPAWRGGIHTAAARAEEGCEAAPSSSAQRPNQAPAALGAAADPLWSLGPPSRPAPNRCPPTAWCCTRAPS
jgi:hypothetical protein